MQIYVYSPDMQMLGIIEKIKSFVWTRRYWEAGSFELLTLFDSASNALLQEGNILIPQGSREAAEIQYRNIEKNRDGYDEIETQGKFLTHWLSRRLIIPAIENLEDTGQNLINTIVDKNCVTTESKRVLPFVLKTDEETISGDNILFSCDEYDNVLDTVTDLAQGSKIGYRMETDRGNGVHTFTVYKGADRSYGNASGNKPCVFSPEYDNILGQKYTVSTEKHRTTAYVTGEEKSGIVPTMVVVHPDEEGLARKELHIKASDVKKTYKDDRNVEHTLSNAEYKKALEDRGLEELEQNAVSQVFSSEINPYANLVYKKDYDLGDVVTCINSRWNLQVDARITEISESYEQGKGTQLSVSFGESLPSVYRQIKKMIK